MRPKRSISERAPLALQRRQLLSLLSDQTPNRLSGNVCTRGPDTKTWQNHKRFAFKSLKSTDKTAQRRAFAQVINRKRRETFDFKKMVIPKLGCSLPPVSPVRSKVQDYQTESNMNNVNTSFHYFSVCQEVRCGYKYLNCDLQYRYRLAQGEWR